MKPYSCRNAVYYVLQETKKILEPLGFLVQIPRNRDPRNVEWQRDQYEDCLVIDCYLTAVKSPKQTMLVKARFSRRTVITLWPTPDQLDGFISQTIFNVLSEVVRTLSKSDIPVSSDPVEEELKRREIA